jgi:hypothetical protein
MAGLLLGLCLAQPAGAGVIPIADFPRADFRPLAYTVFDLTGADIVQFQRVVIDAGIRQRILTPADGGYVRLWAAGDIVLNGVLDARGGSLNLVGNGIILGSGARLDAGGLVLQAGNLNPGDMAYTAGSTALSLSSSTPVWSNISWGAEFTQQAVELQSISGNVFIPSLVLTPIPEPATWSLLLMGLALLMRPVTRFGRRRR